MMESELPPGSCNSTGHLSTIGWNVQGRMHHSASTPAGVDGAGGGARTPPATPKKGGKMLAVRVHMLDDSISMFQIQIRIIALSVPKEQNKSSITKEDRRVIDPSVLAYLLWLTSKKISLRTTEALMDNFSLYLLCTLRLDICQIEMNVPCQLAILFVLVFVLINTSITHLLLQFQSLLRGNQLKILEKEIFRTSTFVNPDCKDIGLNSNT
ncbi:unnamed protein product [Leptidea sinapis]|uniref:Uncharacterized protein n=1 Tax=Leptidea sinapis TaxID=189913 RepID=A0A5E4QJ39_9NEOP|nr:unnamed protein product [Leptidea sinapis]